MPTNDIVRARIDARTKAEATLVLSSIGLTVSDAFRLLLVKVAAEKALPFDLYEPNETTKLAMEEARHAKLQSFHSIDALMAELDENN